MSTPGKPHALFAARSMSHQNRAEMRLAFDNVIKLVERNRATLRVPHDVKPVQNSRDMHYHYRPEFFLGLSGWTDFSFPRETFRLGPDEVCLIPAGVPHEEQIGAPPDKPFRNLVAGFYNNTLSLHFAHEARPGKPDIEVIEFFDAPNLDVFLKLANAIAQTHGTQGPARATVLQGLLLALLGLFRNIVETGTGQLNSDIGKVFQAKCLVREQFANSELCVQHIAEVLGCSADYLSHLFHTETKERLTHYIQRIRIDGSILALESTKLTISEIAYASGFADPAYFARVFKQHKAMTPQEYRLQIEARRKQQEAQPKTVYYDRLDFTHGVPAKKDARPTAD
ncbi:MAG: helix-turn-helix domain-containing protein [Candidatus Didemnitutus sp.]|nr:helix-turn-helix domain-containing protein [Candidatus Didemnitutus sp.]